MNRGSKTVRRRYRPNGHDALDDRVMPSPLGPAHSQVRTVPALVQRADLPAVHDAGHRSGEPACTTAAPTVRQWSWLAETYWYVPTSNLPAVLFNATTGSLAPVSDQTVFQITGYRDGYFWGKTVTQLGSSSASGSSMVGSVTPQGRVLLTFTQTSGSSSPSVTEGFGQMRRKFGRWTMENQMFTSPSATLQIGHWAYMVQTHPGLPSWSSLPSAGVSVPTFLNEAEGSGPQPIGS